MSANRTTGDELGVAGSGVRTVRMWPQLEEISLSRHSLETIPAHVCEQEAANDGSRRSPRRN